MNPPSIFTRRTALKVLVANVATATLAIRSSNAEETPLLSETDPAAKAVNYVADVSRSKEAKPGSKCANCSLYSGDSKSTQALCALFNNKQVTANGWCSAWTNM